MKVKCARYWPETGRGIFTDTEVLVPMHFVFRLSTDQKNMHFWSGWQKAIFDFFHQKLSEVAGGFTKWGGYRTLYAAKLGGWFTFISRYLFAPNSTIISLVICKLVRSYAVHFCNGLSRWSMEKKVRERFCKFRWVMLSDGIRCNHDF